MTTEVKKFPLYLTAAEQTAIRIADIYRKRNQALLRLHESNVKLDEAQKEHRAAVKEFHDLEAEAVAQGGLLAKARVEEKEAGKLHPTQVPESILYGH